MTRMRGGVDRVRTAVSGVNNMLGRTAALAASAGGALGLYFGFRELKAGLIDYNAEIEQMKIGIAGAVSSMAQFRAENSAAQNYMRWLDVADGAINKLRDDAKRLVGTTKDFVQGFSMLSGPIAQTGLAQTSSQLVRMTREFNRLAVAASAVHMGGDIATGVSQLMRMLYGQSGAEMRMAQVMRIVGDEAQRFNKMSPAERYRYLREELVKFQPAVQSFGDSWEGVTSTMQDTAEIIMGQLGKPVFGRLKTYIQEANEWIERHDKQINKLVETYGNKLAKAMERVFGSGTFEDLKWEEVQHGIEKIGDSLKTAAWWGEKFLYLWIGGTVASAIGNIGSIGKGIWEWGAGLRDAIPAMRKFLRMGRTGGLLAVAAGAVAAGYYSMYDIQNTRNQRERERLRKFEKERQQKYFQKWGRDPIGGSTVANRLRRMYDPQLSKLNPNYNPFPSALDLIMREAELARRNLGPEKQSTWATRVRQSIDRIPSASDRAALYGFVSDLGVDSGPGGDEIKSMVRKSGGRSRIRHKPQKIQVTNEYNGPIELHFHDLKETEPDRLAIEVEGRMNRRLTRQSMSGLQSILEAP
jgi:hypothetical protein